MKKFYEKAELEVVDFEFMDVITTSGDVNVDDSTGFADDYEEW